MNSTLHTIIIVWAYMALFLFILAFIMMKFYAGESRGNYVANTPTATTIPFAYPTANYALAPTQETGAGTPLPMRPWIILP